MLLGTGTGRQVTGSALKLGGLAAIGGLAYKAYQNYQNGKQPADAPVAGEPELLPPPADTGFHPSQAPQGEAEFALMLVRAMIAAAKADGHIDDEERKQDRRQAAPVRHRQRGGNVPDRRNWKRPLDLDALVASAQTEEQKVELLHRVASGDRPRYPGRARLPRPAGRSPAACRTRWSITSRRPFPAAKVPVPTGTAPNPRW